MANTVIQLKYSTVTATPTALNVAEPAYSYTSNTLFIGSPAGTGAIAIGGKFYVDQQQAIYDFANAAFAQANTAGSSALVQYAAAHANAAYNQANTNTSDITAIQGVNLTQNTNITNAQNTGDAAFTKANGAYAQANTNTGDITSIQGVNLTQNTNITTAQNTADAAFVRANNSLSANAGGTVTGNVIVVGDFAVTGNMTVSGNVKTIDVETLNITDPLIYLAANNYSSDVVDIGFAANYYDSGDAKQKHTGLIRHAADDVFYLFNNYEPEPENNIIDISDASFRVATLNAKISSTSVVSRGVDILTFAEQAFNKANNEAGVNETQNTSITNAQNTGDAAFAKANTNADNIAVLQGVDLTQNTNITTAQNTADAAFTKANGAFDKANTDFTTINTTAADHGAVFGGVAYIPQFKLEANGRVSQANSTLLLVDASVINSGTLSVARGGTGAGTFTTNGVLLGQGASAFTTASSSTEGHVLTINSSGVPTFAHLSGGTF